jgi:DNA gyrase inhibitor GyrI
MKIFLIIITALLIIWITWSFFADANLESPQYIVLEKKEAYEIRKYNPYIIAETTVGGDTGQPMNGAFRELGGYIFGANIDNKSIAMTAPVTTEQQNKVIAMTAPVVTEQNDEGLTRSFMMPSEFTLENLPTPTSKNVSFREIPTGTFAVLRFTGWASNNIRESKTEKLLSLLERDDLIIISEPQLLQYDQPIKFPWLRTNEIKVEIEL